MRSWLTALDEVTIEREDGTEVTVKAANADRQRAQRKRWSGIK